MEELQRDERQVLSFGPSRQPHVGQDSKVRRGYL
jgi:hypothetical protein